eukprot:TRINITY_DN3316_c0_g1_i1.p1 TRINITY_DN3316_c0_g1~~TRINITY_DN3316_c0_g1_i1.p1  ORF type:complete len:153 (-),score=54.03 TRINITY_DN3316_c0_g1_i1:91-489(-)
MCIRDRVSTQSTWGHLCSIDLKKNALVFPEFEVALPFLSEGQVKRNKKGQMIPESPTGQRSAPLPAPAPAQRPPQGAPPRQGVPIGQGASQFKEEDIQTLMNFGVTRERAIFLLKQTRGNVDLAASLVFSGP